MIFLAHQNSILQRTPTCQHLYMQNKISLPQIVDELLHSCDDVFCCMACACFCKLFRTSKKNGECKWRYCFIFSYVCL